MTTEDDMMEQARKLAEQTPAVPIVWDEKAQAEYGEWWDSLTPEEQERHRDGMIAT